MNASRSNTDNVPYLASSVNGFCRDTRERAAWKFVMLAVASTERKTNMLSS